MVKMGEIDGEVMEPGFVFFFNTSLNADRTEFDHTMEQFMDVARSVRRVKLARRKSLEDQQSQQKPVVPPLNLQPSSPRTRSGEYEGYRAGRLAAVFEVFDLDGSGAIGSDELQKLGTARRTLGQKKGEWTPEQNARLVAKMDQDGDGGIDKQEFVNYFAEALPKAQFDFDTVVDQFMAVAKEVSRGKRARRDSDARRTRANADRRATPSPLASPRSPRSPRLYDLQFGGLDDPVQEIRRRQTCLAHVFKQFDLDASGWVEIVELQCLGESRQSLGQKARDWTAEKNAACLRKIDRNRDGKIELNEFTSHFNEALPEGSRQFDKVIQQFLDCAKDSRAKR